MKVIYSFLVFTVVILISLVFVQIRFNNNSYKSVDMLSINKKISQIKEELNETNKEEIKDKYNCDIIFLTDEFYHSILNKAYQNSDFIVDYMEDDVLIGKFIFSYQKDLFHNTQMQTKTTVFMAFGLLAVLGYSLLFLMYMRYERPFKRFDVFASNISKGDFDFPLERRKKDYFGAFSEAFDVMREALKTAREGEYQANKSKKELIAGLSHDIKTPVSTIRAICELLNVKITDQEVLEKIGIIDSKAKIIDSLMNNMFNAALEELEVLKINVTEEPTTIIKKMFEDTNYYKKIIFLNEPDGFLVYMDKLRLIQVIDNIIDNSYKYANTDIHVLFTSLDDGIKITIRDFGKGCDQDEIYLVTEKFYRGKNSNMKTGSGLGLYLAKHFLVRMNGDLDILIDDGFVVNIFLKKI